MAERRILYLLRHAKSSWDDPGIEDHARPLAPRGLRAAEIMRAHVAALAVAPELVLCSSSRRTRETLAGVQPPGQAVVEDELYHAGHAEVVARLQRVSAPTIAVMVIGHQPTMQSLALSLTSGQGRPAEDSPRAELERKFPTCALATLAFEGPWSELGPGRAELVAFVRPKALRDRAPQ
jgi:phosphohistidine phosphatase